jgi:hypothetical protein
MKSSVKYLCFLILAYLNHSCHLQTKQNIKEDYCNKFREINYKNFYGKPIEVLLSDERFKGYFHGKHPFVTEPNLCLSFIRVGLGHGVYLDVYPYSTFKYSQKCREDYNWDFEFVIKETLAEVKVMCY